MAEAAFAQFAAYQVRVRVKVRGRGRVNLGLT